MNLKMKIVSSLLVYIVLSYLKIQVRSDSSLATAFAKATSSEEGMMDFIELARLYGHEYEEHNVITEDGYILKTFCTRAEKPPILLFHGIADSSDSFVVSGYCGLAIALASRGHSVCVANHRGNKYSRRHTTLDPDFDKEYWNFSLHEIGYYDLAATIDFVREISGYESIVTIGHSQGATAHLVLTSLRPEYNDRIKTFIALGPIAFLNNLDHSLSSVASAGPAVNRALLDLGTEEILRDRFSASNFINTMCYKAVVSNDVCESGVILPFASFDPTSLEPEYRDDLFGHYPAGTSRKSVIHINQIALRKRFSQYDYGTTDNLAIYGTPNPPDYDLSTVTMPVVVVYVEDDVIATVKDVEHLKESLPNVVRSVKLETDLNHFDMVWGKNMNETLYPVLLPIIEKYNGENSYVKLHKALLPEAALKQYLSKYETIWGSY